MKKLYKWLIAHTTDKPCWRVTYENQITTSLLPRHEAKRRQEVYNNGVMWIDYDNGGF